MDTYRLGKPLKTVIVHQVSAMLCSIEFLLLLVVVLLFCILSLTLLLAVCHSHCACKLQTKLLRGYFQN